MHLKFRKFDVELETLQPLVSWCCGMADIENIFLILMKCSRVIKILRLQGHYNKYSPDLKSYPRKKISHKIIRSQINILSNFFHHIHLVNRIHNNWKAMVGLRTARETTKEVIQQSGISSKASGSDGISNMVMIKPGKLARIQKKLQNW